MTRTISFTMKSLLTAGILMLAVTLSTSALAKASLEKVRIGQSTDKTRVVFEIKKNHHFEVSKLNHPARIVVDFYQATNKISFKQKKFLDARLGKIRIKNQKKRIRVVLDLRQNFDYSYFTLGKNSQGSERVVIDVSKKIVSNKKAPKKIVKKTTIKVPAKSRLANKVVKVPAKKVVKVASKKSAPVKMASAPQKTRSLMNSGSPVFFDKRKDLVVAIDAGHGGKDTGAIGHNHTREKVVVLELAKQLKKYIDKQPGMRAVLTRNSDKFIPLHKRVRIAHQKDADIFISLHADSFKDSSARGGSVYILSTKGASSVMARVLAKSENASLYDIKLKGRDSDVAFVLSDMTREANIRASRKLGSAVLGEMGVSVRLHKSSVQSANFAVLKSIDMPSLLIETAFVSNPSEAKKLKSNRFQVKMAKSIVRGLSKFVKRNAQQPRWGETLYVHYRVQSGDTLSEIAANYKISTKVLKKLNKINKANQLYVGKKLRIPVSEKVIASL